MKNVLRTIIVLETIHVLHVLDLKSHKEDITQDAVR